VIKFDVKNSLWGYMGHSDPGVEKLALALPLHI
jgi:hypothetical protein